MMYLLFDIGGTNMRFAVSRDGKKLDESRIVDTPKDFNDGVLCFQKLAKELSGGEKITAVAGGIAGPLDKEKTKLINSPNIGGWSNKPLKAELEKVIGAPVYVENDTVLFGLGEANFGNIKDYSIAAYITIGTGVGGARIVDCSVDRSALGFELGHQVIKFEGLPCPCGGFGHLEAYVSGGSIERRYGKKAYEIDDPRIWDSLSRELAYGLNNTIVTWSPDVIVLGGSVMQKYPMDRIRFHLDDILTIFPEAPPLKEASLGDLGGLYGGMILLNQMIK